MTAFELLAYIACPWLLLVLLLLLGQGSSCHGGYKEEAPCNCEHEEAAAVSHDLRSATGKSQLCRGVLLNNLLKTI